MQGDWSREPPSIDGTYIARIRGILAVVRFSVFRDDEANPIGWDALFQAPSGLGHEVSEGDVDFWWTTPIPMLPPVL